MTTPTQNNVISFSGGKDSTAMTLLALEKGMPIHSLVAFDREERCVYW